jgi:DNA primase
MWAPCPFHQEKSASFHVDDRKGYYYCFGCHAKGDALTFIQETENLGFMEAVEVLAREAGMPMPERDARAAQVADRRTQLIAVMDEAVKWFRLQLKTSAAAEARAYLVKRGLSEAAQDRWDIGFAPDGWHGLQLAMKQKGISDDLLVASGLKGLSDEIGNLCNYLWLKRKWPTHLQQPSPRSESHGFGNLFVGATWLKDPPMHIASTFGGHNMESSGHHLGCNL